VTRRTAYCVVVGASTIKDVTPTPISGVEDAVRRMRDLLQERFSVPVVSLRAEAANMSNFSSALRGAVDAVKAPQEPADLVVLSFSGHGYYDGSDHVWELHDGVYTDRQLAAWFKEIWGVETFVVSDCCGALGMWYSGPNDEPPSAWASLVQSMLELRYSAEFETRARDSVFWSLVKEAIDRFVAWLRRRYLAARMASLDELLRSIAQTEGAGRLLFASAAGVEQAIVHMGYSEFVNAFCAALPKCSTNGDLRREIKSLRPSKTLVWDLLGVPEGIMAEPILASDQPAPPPVPPVE
jgi:hypothetical protein